MRGLLFVSTSMLSWLHLGYFSSCSRVVYTSVKFPGQHSATCHGVTFSEQTLGGGGEGEAQSKDQGDLQGEACSSKQVRTNCTMELDIFGIGL